MGFVQSAIPLRTACAVTKVTIAKTIHYSYLIVLQTAVYNKLKSYRVKGSKLSELKNSTSGIHFMVPGTAFIGGWLKYISLLFFFDCQG